MALLRAAAAQGPVIAVLARGGGAPSCALPACSPASSPQPHLAVGSNDHYVSVYSVEKRVR